MVDSLICFGLLGLLWLALVCFGLLWLALVGVGCTSRLDEFKCIRQPISPLSLLISPVTMSSAKAAAPAPAPAAKPAEQPPKPDIGRLYLAACRLGTNEETPEDRLLLKLDNPPNMVITYNDAPVKENKEAENEEEEHEEAPRIRFETAPVDPRFATTINKAKQCWILYNEWLQCLKMNGGKNTPECQKAELSSVALCPSAWV